MCENGSPHAVRRTPSSVKAERFRGYGAAGVNRLSLGVQSLRDADLKDAILVDADLEGANLEDADLEGANLEGAVSVPELSAKQEEDACWSDCG